MSRHVPGHRHAGFDEAVIANVTVGTDGNLGHDVRECPDASTLANPAGFYERGGMNEDWVHTTPTSNAVLGFRPGADRLRSLPRKKRWTILLPQIFPLGDPSQGRVPATRPILYRRAMQNRRTGTVSKPPAQFLLLEQSRERSNIGAGIVTL